MGVPYRCPRMGGWDKGNTSWQRISQSEIRKIAAAKKEATKARAGKNSFPPTPLPFCPPKRNFIRNRRRDFLENEF